MRFRPSVPATITSGIALAILVNLGLWQYGRHVTSSADLITIHAHLDAPLATNADLSKPPAELGWRKATLTGQFVDTAPYLVSGRFEFGQPGYDVLAPFVPDGGATTMLVNRGWIPDQGWKEALADVGSYAPSGVPTTVDGLLMTVDSEAEVTPLPATDAHPERWPQETTTYAGFATRVVGPPWHAIARRAGITAGVYLVVGPELKHDQGKAHDHMPISGYVAEPYAIDHLSYAIQWFAIGGVLVGAWAWSGIRRGREV